MNQNNTRPSITIGQPALDLSFSSRSIYGKFSLILLVFIFVTLIPHYGEISSSTTFVSAQFIAHGILYLGWYILFAVQSHLSSARNVALHKKLGYISLLLVGALIFSGIDMLLGVMKGYDSTWSAGYLASRTSFVWAILHTLLSFVAFYTLGIVFRKKLHFHKRFMVMASLSMISASVTRVAFLPIVPVDGMAVTLLSTYALLLAPVIIDRIIFGSVHPVLKWSVPIYIITQIICIGVIPNTEVGRAIAFPF
ncbi:hypothetical protein FKG94_27925 [Exilibacterium tricleocarpae]|uniref:DUF2306 domain-containing protein n=1 Tax=Exilibacterium tricleocarpae TaxID=2591008 RepID=A0A545SLH7_9GAMM|nr:hypothetical protein [Exilibacterium tricleocarpae]TQV65837.1 hypothetical protein FKG94_27925 [Exilibacterium tricleocarpae]